MIHGVSKVRRTAFQAAKGCIRLKAGKDAGVPSHPSQATLETPEFTKGDHERKENEVPAKAAEGRGTSHLRRLRPSGSLYSYGPSLTSGSASRAQARRVSSDGSWP